MSAKKKRGIGVTGRVRSRKEASARCRLQQPVLMLIFVFLHEYDANTYIRHKRYIDIDTLTFASYTDSRAADNTHNDNSG